MWTVSFGNWAQILCVLISLNLRISIGKKLVFLLATVGGIWIYLHPFIFLWVSDM